MTRAEAGANFSVSPDQHKIMSFSDARWNLEGKKSMAKSSGVLGHPGFGHKVCMSSKREGSTSWIKITADSIPEVPVTPRLDFRLH